MITLKLKIYNILFPVIKGLVVFFFGIKKTRLCTAFYSSLRHVHGLQYFCIDTDNETFLVNLNDHEIAKSLFCTGLFDFEKLLTSIDIIKTRNNYQN